jgi:hypothetical protein
MFPQFSFIHMLLEIIPLSFSKALDEAELQIQHFVRLR